MREEGFSGNVVMIRDVKRAEGSAVFPALGNNFRCLQQAGDWCN